MIKVSSKVQKSSVTLTNYKFPSLMMNIVVTLFVIMFEICRIIVSIPILYCRFLKHRFSLFDLEDGEDFLSLGNGAIPRRYPLFYRRTGDIRSYDGLRHVSSSTDMWMIFETSVAIARKGFEVKFSEVPINGRLSGDSVGKSMYTAMRCLSRSTCTPFRPTFISM